VFLEHLQHCDGIDTVAAHAGDYRNLFINLKQESKMIFLTLFFGEEERKAACFRN